MNLTDVKAATTKKSPTIQIKNKKPYVPPEKRLKNVGHTLKL